MSKKFYIDTNGVIQSVDLDELRDQLNMRKGTTMPRGIAPKYEIQERTVFVAGYNAFQKFHDCQTFDTEADAIEWLNNACDELISDDQERSYYDTEEEARIALNQFNEENE